MSIEARVSTTQEYRGMGEGRLELAEHPEAQIRIQIDILRKMIPEEWLPKFNEEVAREDYDPKNLSSRLLERYTLKYSAWFGKFCDEHKEDRDLMERMKTATFDHNTLTSEDTAAICAYLEAHAGPLFADDTEKRDFYEPYLH